jgi:hypothetical protein
VLVKGADAVQFSPAAEQIRRSERGEEKQTRGKKKLKERVILNDKWSPHARREIGDEIFSFD